MDNDLSVIEDLYQYNQWAHGRMFRLCEGLTDPQLNAIREMGFGSLRNTLFHIMAAEEIWIERWTAQPWRAFPTDAQNMSLQAIEQKLAELHSVRQALIAAERADGWTRSVTYRDSRGNEYRQPLRLLLLHVANHSIHHRAQVMSFLKSFGRTVPVGLDYLMYKLARPTVAQSTETTTALSQKGIEMASGQGVQVAWDAEIIKSYFDYHDWANAQVLQVLEDAGDELWDQAFDMGQGSIRKTLTHLLDAELWWQTNWIGAAAAWKNSSHLGLSELNATWQQLREQRTAMIDKCDDQMAQQVLTVVASGPRLQVRRIESMIQLCGHGTYHRAQVVNMLRHVGLKPPAIDVMVWCR